MRAVSMFSSGAGSWAATRCYVDRNPHHDLVMLFADTGPEDRSEHQGEDEDNYRFLEQAARDIARPLIRLRDGRDVWQVFRDQRMIGNTRISNCSRTLKQDPAHRWLSENRSPEDTVVIIGIDWTEDNRRASIVKRYAPYRVVFPLCEPPYLDKDDVVAELAGRGIAPPRLYGMGFAHANCGGFCVRAGQGQFAHLLRTMPERYAYHEAQEQAFREWIDKDVAILRDRRGGTTKPLTLTALRKRLTETPEQVDLDDVGGCGCFVDDEPQTTTPPPEETP